MWSIRITVFHPKKAGGFRAEPRRHRFSHSGDPFLYSEISNSVYGWREENIHAEKSHRRKIRRILLK
jgi:hypothetical protein